MTRDDLPAFVTWITELAEYFPHTKVNLEVMVSGYFRALRPLDVATLRPLFDEVLRQCRFFPTVSELLAIAATLPTPDTCKRCPGGHGVHAGHAVKHYESGPYCDRCQVPLPVPPGYVPYSVPRALPQIPERTDAFTLSEIQELLAPVYAAINKRSERLSKPLTGEDSPNGTYRPRLGGDALEERRAFLREQAHDLLDETRIRWEDMP
jgi:hypothetical protein